MKKDAWVYVGLLAASMTMFVFGGVCTFGSVRVGILEVFTLMSAVWFGLAVSATRDELRTKSWYTMVPLGYAALMLAGIFRSVVPASHSILVGLISLGWLVSCFFFGTLLRAEMEQIRRTRRGERVFL